MKILVISHMYPSSFNKISGIFVHQQVKALVEEGCEVKVVSPIPYAPYMLSFLNKKWKAYRNVPYRDNIDFIDIYHPRYIEFPRGIFFDKSGKFMARGVAKTIENIHRDFKFDIIHSHVALPDGYAGMVINKKYNAQHVVTIHGQDFQNTMYRNDKCKYELFKVLNNVDRIITVSNKLKEMVKGENFYSKITTVNNGIDEDIILKSYIEGQQRDEIKIISVSNLKETKGIQYNLYALSELVKKYENIHYDIIGDGEYRFKLENLVDELSLRPFVSFLGKKEHVEVISLLNNYDIFSLPSYKEGFGMVYIEAMAQGLPVIGIKGEGISDVIENGVNGFLVEGKNKEELVGVLEKLISDKDMRIAVGKNALKTVKENFTWKKNAQNVVKIYKQLINRE